MKKNIIIFLVMVNTWSITNPLPQGAPTSVCSSMLPVHGGGILPSQLTPPFRIDITSNIVGQDQSIRVDILPITAGLTFGGYMIHAQNLNSPHQVIGQFKENSDEQVKLINCGDTSSTATHTKPNPKESISLEWIAPSDFIGEIIFNATIAKTYGEFWLGITSEPVKIVKRGAVPETAVVPLLRPAIRTTTPPIYIPTEEKQTKITDPFYSGCGSTKTCFGLPDGCLVSQTCSALASIIVRGDRYQFELKSLNREAQYVAFGLSDDDKMGDDSIMECVNFGNRTVLYSSWTTPRPNLGVTRSQVPQSIAKLLNSNSIDGKFYCHIERNPLTYVNQKKFDLINEKHFLLLASGKSVGDNGAGYHDLGRIVTAKRISLAEIQDLDSSSTLLLRLHGAFMVVAWIGATSIGIVLARYYKLTWVGRQLCGKDQWFAWHRISMVITWSLTMAGFIIIFIELDGWSAERNPHAILGVITTVICFFQPIGAFLRPSPSSKNRIYFNWGHWFAGNAAHILAIVTIFYAIKLTKAELPEWLDWILVAYVAFHVISHLGFSIISCASDRRNTQRVSSFPMSDMPRGRNGMKVDQKHDASFTSLRKIALTGYIIILTFIVLAIVIIVVLAPIENTVQNLKSKIMDN